MHPDSLLRPRLDRHRAIRITPSRYPRRLLVAKFFTGRSSDFRIILRPRLPTLIGQWRYAAFVPGNSGGTVTDSHRLPY